MGVSAKRAKTSSFVDRDSGGGDGTADASPENTSVEDEAERANLAEQLVERDKSIAILRGLLAEKTAAAGKINDDQAPEPSSTAGRSAGVASPLAKKLDYSAMSLPRLRQLDKARDATIAFVLRQLDKLEEGEEKKKRVEADEGKDGPRADEVGLGEEEDQGALD